MSLLQYFTLQSPWYSYHPSASLRALQYPKSPLTTASHFPSYLPCPLHPSAIPSSISHIPGNPHLNKLCSLPCSYASQSQNCRDWKDLWMSLVLLKQGQEEQVAQGHVHLGFKYLQGWRLHGLTGQLVSVFDHQHSKNFFLKVKLIVEYLALSCDPNMSPSVSSSDPYHIHLLRVPLTPNLHALHLHTEADISHDFYQMCFACWPGRGWNTLHPAPGCDWPCAWTFGNLLTARQTKCNHQGWTLSSLSD